MTSDPVLIELLERAARLPPPTPAQRQAQREGWAIAAMGMGSDADEAAYAAAVATEDRKKMARLDWESEERMNRARAYFAAQKELNQ